MTVRVHIERLVIDAGLGLDPRTLETALAEGLAQALQGQPPLALLQQDGSVATLAGAEVRLAPNPAARGRQFGGALHAALAQGKTP